MGYKEEWIGYYKYLEEVREAGYNMYGATPYLVDQFLIKKRLARTILASYMEHYDLLRKDGVI